MMVLTIAGSDPSGGAGLQADLRAFAHHGLFGAAVVAAITAQSASDGVSRAVPTPPDLLAAQLQAAFVDRPIGAAKTGMLGHGQNVDAVADHWRDLDVPLVVDPVVRSSGGVDLLGPGGLHAMRSALIPLATIVTPNLDEAAALTRRADLDAEDLARAVADLGARAVLVTGGHGAGDTVRDVALVDGRIHVFEAPRLPSVHDHGTGCLLSSCIAAALALGRDLIEAAEHGVRCARRGLEQGAAGSVWLDRVPD